MFKPRTADPNRPIASATKSSPRRAALVVAFAVGLALTGCRGPENAETDVTETVIDEVVEEVAAEGTSPADDSAALETVQVTGALGQKPTLEFDQPLTVSTVTTRLVDPGEGAPLEAGQQVTLDYASVDGNNGETLFSTWDTPADRLTMAMGSQQMAPISEALTGANVGARMLFASPTELNGELVTVLTVFEVVDALTIPSRAEGETVTDLPDGLPTVTLADNGEPTLTIPDGFTPSDELSVTTLIEGTGPVVNADQFVTVQYTGWLVDGTVFDSSWSRGEPTGFPLRGVIPGWTEGLAGQHVGSQVLLVIPPEMGYGAQAAGAIPPNSTLIFVVDILAAQ